MKERRRDAAVSDVWIDKVLTRLFCRRLCSRRCVSKKTSVELVHLKNVTESRMLLALSPVSYLCKGF